MCEVNQRPEDSDLLAWFAVGSPLFSCWPPRGCWPPGRVPRCGRQGGPRSAGRCQPGRRHGARWEARTSSVPAGSACRAVRPSSSTPRCAPSSCEPRGRVAVDGLPGGGNVLDVLVLGGSVTNSFTWVTPSNSTTLHPLGYATTGLRQDGPLTLTVPAGAVVKGGGSPSGASITVAGGIF